MHQLWLWITQQKPIQIITEVVAVCSLLHSIMPPWDWDPDFVRIGWVEFPSAQNAFHKLFNNRWYRVMVYVIGYIALNGRSTVWKFISVKNPDGPNANCPTIEKAANNIVNTP